MVTAVRFPASISRRKRTWEPTLAPPAQYKDFAYPEGGKLLLSATGAEIVRDGIDEIGMSFPAVLSTSAVDRVGDVVLARGCRTEAYRRVCAPVFFGHQVMPLPLGSALDKEGKLHVAVDGDRVLGRCFVVQEGKWAETAQDIFHLIAQGFLGGISIGFDPVGPVKELDTGGHLFEIWDILEFSTVGVPANEFCHVIRKYLSDGKITHKTIHPMLVKSLEPLAAPAVEWASGADLGGVRSVAAAPGRRPFSRQSADPVRWNKSLSASFDVADEAVPPSRLEYDWVSKHLECPVKEVFQSGTLVPSARMGSWLTGLRHGLTAFELVDVRNLSGYESRESPPVYEVLQLTSTLREDFLIDGTAFYRGQGRKFALAFQPDFTGLHVTCFTKYVERDFNRKILEDAGAWARENNFLKGEAFSLSGEFLPRTQEGWDDVFLEEVNKASLRRTTDLLNRKGKAFACRGVIMTGPPGTGKTLSGRIIRNQADATFVWISARDFYHAGAFGGISLGFEMARELAPSVLFMEDVDNWIGERTIDLLKTEMDGIARSSGVLTVLTTNFPEQLPEALIDRPGRFHDVLRFGLPTKEARRAMLGKWLQDVPGADVERAVEGTEGYSGAHVYELAQFARTLREHDGLEATQALREAMRKVEEQRDLITEMQLAGSRYRPRKALEKAMSKKHVKGLEDSSGTGGGYATPSGDGGSNFGGRPQEETKSRIKEVMDHHAADAPAEGPHDAYLHAEKGMVHHHHCKSASLEHLGRVKADLGAIDGITGVTQKDVPPDEAEGFEKVYAKGGDMAGGGLAVTPAPNDAKSRKPRSKAVLPSQSQRDLVKRLAPAWVKFLPARAKDALEDCVHRKIPKIAEDHPEMPDEQRVAVAFSTCGESAEKDFDEGDGAETKAPEEVVLGEHQDPEEGGDMPHGAALCQEVIELIESKLGQMEPERAEYWQEVLSELIAHGNETYPDLHFGGEEDVPGASESPAESEQETEDALAPYQGVPRSWHNKPVWGLIGLLRSGKDLSVHRRRTIKRAIVAVTKNLHPKHKQVVKEAADHHHKMADYEFGVPIKPKDRAMCRMHGRALDAMHGAVTGDVDEPMTAKGEDIEDEEDVARHDEEAGQEEVGAPVEDAGEEKRLVIREEGQAILADVYRRLTGKKSG